jgi:hypothetical protein
MYISEFDRNRLPTPILEEEAADRSYCRSYCPFVNFHFVYIMYAHCFHMIGNPCTQVRNSRMHVRSLIARVLIQSARVKDSLR